MIVWYNFWSIFRIFKCHLNHSWNVSKQQFQRSRVASRQQLKFSGELTREQVRLYVRDDVMRPQRQLDLMRGPDDSLWPVAFSRGLVQPLGHGLDVADELQVLLGGVVDAFDVRYREQTLVGHEGGALRTRRRQQRWNIHRSRRPFTPTTDRPYPKPSLYPRLLNLIRL